MNCLSINIQGLVSKAKKDWIKGLNNFHKVTFLSIQETKMDSISETEIKALWDNYRFEYIFSEAVGASGGILCMWDPCYFRKEHHILSDNFVVLYGMWIPKREKVLMISIYAPQSTIDKHTLWDYISSLVCRWNGLSRSSAILTRLDIRKIGWGLFLMPKELMNSIASFHTTSHHKPRYLQKISHLRPSQNGDSGEPKSFRHLCILFVFYYNYFLVCVRYLLGYIYK